MNLPVYQHINLKSAALDDLIHILTPDINLKHPVVVNVLALDMDQQREAIGLIENYFVSSNLSFRFPYPLYILSQHEASISKVPLILDTQNLPKFYTQRETKMNVRETHLAGKNKLLQQEVRNSDSSTNVNDIDSYGNSHRTIYELEIERKFYRTLLNRLVKASRNG
jgi:hypothetical protein